MTTKKSESDRKIRLPLKKKDRHHPFKEEGGGKRLLPSKGGGKTVKASAGSRKNGPFHPGSPAIFEKKEKQTLLFSEKKKGGGLATSPCQKERKRVAPSPYAIKKEVLGGG